MIHLSNIRVQIASDNEPPKFSVNPIHMIKVYYIVRYFSKFLCFSVIWIRKATEHFFIRETRTADSSVQPNFAQGRS